MIYTLRNIIIKEGFDINKIDLQILGYIIYKNRYYNPLKKYKKINVNKNGQFIKIYLYNKYDHEWIVKYLHENKHKLNQLSNQTNYYDKRRSYYFNKFKL